MEPKQEDEILHQQRALKEHSIGGMAMPDVIYLSILGLKLPEFLIKTSYTHELHSREQGSRVNDTLKPAVWPSPKAQEWNTQYLFQQGLSMECCCLPATLGG